VALAVRSAVAAYSRPPPRCHIDVVDAPSLLLQASRWGAWQRARPTG